MYPSPFDLDDSFFAGIAGERGEWHITHNEQLRSAGSPATVSTDGANHSFFKKFALSINR